MAESPSMRLARADVNALDQTGKKNPALRQQARPARAATVTAAASTTAITTPCERLRAHGLAVSRPECGDSCLARLRACSAGLGAYAAVLVHLRVLRAFITA